MTKLVTAIWIGEAGDVAENMRDYEIRVRGMFPLDDLHIRELPSGKIVVIITADEGKATETTT